MTTLDVKTRNGAAFRDSAFMANRDAPIHRWVPWIAGYSKHFVEDALTRHASGPGVVLDPFAGVGTTLVEADLAGHEAVGFEINPYAAFAAQAKLKAHRLDPDYLRSTSRSRRTGSSPESRNRAASRLRRSTFPGKRGSATASSIRASARGRRTAARFTSPSWS